MNKGITINISSVPNTSDPIVIDSAPTDKNSNGTWYTAFKVATTSMEW